jgi:titin
VLVGGGAGDTITDDYIGMDASGTTARGDEFGVVLEGGASRTLLSGDVISGNTDAGVYIIGPTTSNNRVQGDFIGTNYTGEGALGNGWDGVVITDGANGNTIGGTTAGAGDVISANGIDGV